MVDRNKDGQPSSAIQQIVDVWKKPERENITLVQKLNSICVWIHAKIETHFAKQQPRQKNKPTK